MRAIDEKIYKLARKERLKICSARQKIYAEKVKKDPVKAEARRAYRRKYLAAYRAERKKDPEKYRKYKLDQARWRALYLERRNKLDPVTIELQKKVIADKKRAWHLANTPSDRTEINRISAESKKICAIRKLYFNKETIEKNKNKEYMTKSYIDALLVAREEKKLVFRERLNEFLDEEIQIKNLYKKYGDTYEYTG